uniref:Putative esophageal gland cell secretory protein 19 n=1 Tax=Meloidogyne incognita TaxID=6306 RepID=Q7YWJ2_MELIC|nr:putative esophageal gland cell secretory protein 19 [Meloidogyne incognita]
MSALLFTSTLLIISLAFIAIAEGTGDRNASASSPGCMQVATLIHIGEIRPAKANKPGVQNTLKMSGNAQIFKTTQVTLQVAGQEPCTVKINNGETKCKITGDELNGKLIFKTEKGTEISASFEQAKLFSENKCVIELDTYNKETHETKLKINGNNFMIKKKEGSVSIKCGGRANTV